MLPCLSLLIQSLHKGPSRSSSVISPMSLLLYHWEELTSLLGSNKERQKNRSRGREEENQPWLAPVICQALCRVLAYATCNFSTIWQIRITPIVIWGSERWCNLPRVIESNLTVGLMIQILFYLTPELTFFILYRIISTQLNSTITSQRNTVLFQFLDKKTWIWELRILPKPTENLRANRTKQVRNQKQGCISVI